MRELKKVSSGLLRKSDIGGGEPDGDVYHCEAVISSTDYDSQFSRFDVKSMENFVEEINGDRVVPFLNSHDMKATAVLGRIESAQLQDDKVVAQISMLRDTDATPEQLRVDEYIRRIQHGYFNEVSVGYARGDDICDICGHDVWGRGEEICPHWPGEKYDGVVATYVIQDAGLREVSLVYRGANPSAQIQQRREDPELVKMKNAGGKNLQPEKTEPSDSLRAMLEADGKRYRERLLETLCEEGVRAMGTRFDEGAWRERYSKLDSSAIEEQIDVFMLASDGQFPKGRQTEDTTSGGKYEGDVNSLPAWLFA